MDRLSVDRQNVCLIKSETRHRFSTPSARAPFMLSPSKSYLKSKRWPEPSTGFWNSRSARYFTTYFSRREMPMGSHLVIHLAGEFGSVHCDLSRCLLRRGHEPALIFRDDSSLASSLSLCAPPPGGYLQDAPPSVSRDWRRRHSIDTRSGEQTLVFHPPLTSFDHACKSPDRRHSV